MAQRLLVLVNPTAAGGRAHARLGPMTGELDRLGADYRVVETRSSDHARDAAAEAVRTAERVLAVGGDGLLRPLARALAGSSVELALAPAGRGNDLARALGLPSEPAAAARLALHGEARAVDVAEVDGAPFMGIASVGFDSEANRIANSTRLFGGQAVYLYAALRALLTWRHARFTVTVDGVEHALSGYSVAVANSTTYGGGMRIAPGALLDDGELDVIATGPKGRLGFLATLPRVFRGTHVDDPQVTVLRGRRIELAADRAFEVYADGDPIAGLPARVTVRQRALRLVVPG